MLKKDILLLHIVKSCLFSGMYLCILLIALSACYLLCAALFSYCVQACALLLELNEVKTHLWHFRLALDKNQPSLEINKENYQLAKSVAAVDTLYT